jgi:CHAD domain-containing protein
MDARTRPGERVKLAILSELLDAAQALQKPHVDDEALHDARKKLRRARAGLRLLRPVDEQAYRRENVRLRDAGRRLSAVRDAKVLLGVLDQLAEKERKRARRRLVERLRMQVEKRRGRDWRSLRAGQAMGEIVRALHETATQIESLPSSAGAALPLEKLYRKAGTALKRSRRKPSDARLHEARKQAKHFMNALLLLAPGEPPRRVRKVLDRALNVDERLGDDHDLALVEEMLAGLPRGARKGRRSLGRCIGKRRARLQSEALEAGAKLFRRETRRVVAEAAG